MFSEVVRSLSVLGLESVRLEQPLSQLTFEAREYKSKL